MSLTTRLARAWRDPAAAAMAAVGRVSPDRLFARHARLAREAGIDGVRLVLSFDCDTLEDARVAWDVHQRLADLGVQPAYAVPGEVLLEGAAVYERIVGTGAELLNHGHRRHTYWDEAASAHLSCFFYDQQPRDVVREDIVQGDRTLREFLGRDVAGFRTPHFGSFQSPEQLRFLHGVLADLGYRFSSSAVPTYGFRHGPVFDRFGLAELPVSGMGTLPLGILDTWSCFAAPNRRFAPEDFRRQGTALLRGLQRAGAGVINVYGDPLHIHDEPIFFETVAAWAEATTPMTFAALAAHA